MYCAPSIFVQTCILQGLLGRSLQAHQRHQSSSWAAATGVPVYDQPRTLVMHEISEQQPISPRQALSADVACLVYDVTDAESFRYVANIYLVGSLCIQICEGTKAISIKNNYAFWDKRGLSATGN